MLRVSELERFRADGTVEVVARYVCASNGAVEIVAADPVKKQIAVQLAREGVTARDGVRLTIDDGERFVAELPWAIRGDRIWATRNFEMDEDAALKAPE